MQTLEEATQAHAEARAAFELSLGDLHAKIDRMEARQSRKDKLADLMRYVAPVPVTCPAIPLAAGAGTITNMPDTLGPHDGFVWFIIQFTAASFSAGTVTVYRNFINDPNQMFTFTQAGTFYFGATQCYLGDSDMLAFSAAGITGNVTLSGWAINVPTPLVPDYLL